MTRSSLPKKPTSKPFEPATDAEKAEAFKKAGQLAAHLEERAKRMKMLDEFLASQEKPEK